MMKCEYQDFPCRNIDYHEFDETACGELSKPISADELLNSSRFCMRIPVNNDFVIGDMDYKLYLKTLRGAFGLYHLWIEYEHCDDHDTYTMLCVYVGKGPPDVRIASHIKKKWKCSAELFVTFTPMNNRLSKYYEQLFLDCYGFELNNAENSGTKYLFAVWNEDLYNEGTHLHEVSNLSEIQGPDDW